MDSASVQSPPAPPQRSTDKWSCTTGGAQCPYTMPAAKRQRRPPQAFDPLVDGANDTTRLGKNQKRVATPVVKKTVTKRAVVAPAKKKAAAVSPKRPPPGKSIFSPTLIQRVWAVVGDLENPSTEQQRPGPDPSRTPTRRAAAYASLSPPSASSRSRFTGPTVSYRVVHDAALRC